MRFAVRNPGSRDHAFFVSRCSRVLRTTWTVDVIIAEPSSHGNSRMSQMLKGIS